jgi:hypothetical protein
MVVVRVDGELRRPRVTHGNQKLALLGRIVRRRVRRVPASVKKSKCLVVIDCAPLHNAARVDAIGNEAHRFTTRRQDGTDDNEHSLLAHLRHGQVRVASSSIQHDVGVAHLCCFRHRAREKQRLLEASANRLHALDEILPPACVIRGAFRLVEDRKESLSSDQSVA